MRAISLTAGVTSILFSGAIFGFFYAWICSTMWGLDAADPRLAIGAMQVMNASVRNATFAPAFFGTPLVLWLTAVLAHRAGARGAAIWFGLGGLIYAGGGVFLTFTINVPMNEALALVTIPEARAEAAEIWAAYSPRWQVWNITRTIVSGAALAMAALGLIALSRRA